MRINRNLMSARLAACAVAALLSAPDAWGYAEEQTDPTGQANASTHHLYLTRALAVCAGLDYAKDVSDPLNPSVITHALARDAEIIALNDEMTDVGIICMQADSTGKRAPCTGNGCQCVSGDTTWTNCSAGSIPEGAVAGDRGQCRSAAATDVAWEVFPMVANTPATNAQGALAGGAWQPALGCFSQRFSPWSPLFHFPEEADLERLRKFAAGEPLVARAAYAYGPVNSSMWTGKCYQRPLGAVPTGVVKPGSLEAFGMYLHSLGDFNSHRMCRDNWSSSDRPTWYFHTQGGGLTPASPTGVLNCGFNDHAFEFGCADTARRGGFLNGTQDGAERVYDALLHYAKSNGKAPRIASLEAHGQWLKRQIQLYVAQYRPSVLLGQNAPQVSQVEQAAASCRRDFAWQLLQACVANAGAAPTACLPDVAVSASSCPAAGQVGQCPGGQTHFPITPVAPSCGKVKTTD